MAEIFDKAISDELRQYMGIKTTYDSLNDQLAQIATQVINPDSYTGTDVQKIQSAINACLASNGANEIKLYRIYDLTGGTVNIDRGDVRYPTRISGGGFKKTDSGYMFSSTLANGLSSDSYFTNCFFQGVTGNGMTVFNFDKLIRVHTTNCHFRSVDKIGYSSGYTQSYRSLNDTIFSGSGYAFDFGDCYDTSFDNMTMEQRDSGIRINGQSMSVRVVNSVLEGLTGTAFNHLGTVSSLTIENNYFETNAANIVFGSTIYMRGLSIKKNYITGNASTFIVWGKYASTCVSEGNHAVSTVTMHDATNTLAGAGIIFSTNDYNEGGPADINPNGVITYQMAQKYTQSAGVTTSYLGLFKRISYQYTASQSFNANSTTTVQINMGVPIHSDDFITVQLKAGSYNLSVAAVWAQNNFVNVKVISTDSVTDSAVTLTVNVLQPYYSVLG